MLCGRYPQDEFQAITDYNPVVYLNTPNTLSRLQSLCFNPCSGSILNGVTDLAASTQPILLVGPVPWLSNLWHSFMMGSPRFIFPVILSLSSWLRHTGHSRLLGLCFASPYPALPSSCFSLWSPALPAGNMNTLLVALRQSPHLSHPPHKAVPPVPLRGMV
jgi:hypothetical protein